MPDLIPVHQQTTLAVVSAPDFHPHPIPTGLNARVLVEELTTRQQVLQAWMKGLSEDLQQVQHELASVEQLLALYTPNPTKRLAKPRGRSAITRHAHVHASRKEGQP